MIASKGKFDRNQNSIHGEIYLKKNKMEYGVMVSMQYDGSLDLLIDIFSEHTNGNLTFPLHIQGPLLFNLS